MADIGKTVQIRARVVGQDADEDVLRVAGPIISRRDCLWAAKRHASFRRSDCSLPPNSPNNSLTTFRLSSFNLLAKEYARTSFAIEQMYPYCNRRHLDIKYRKTLLAREVVELDCDIMCFQETSSDLFEDFLVPLLRKTHQGRLTLKAGRVAEGCTMFFRRDMFDLETTVDVKFSEALVNDAHYKDYVKELKLKWPTFFDDVLPHMTTIFQFTVLRCSSSSDYIIIGNTHLFYHPNAMHIRILQCMVMAHESQKLVKMFKKKGKVCTILCGDLNSLPTTGSITLLKTGHVPSNHPDWEYGTIFKWGDVGHSEGDDAKGVLVVPLPDDISSEESVLLSEGMGVTINLKNSVGFDDAYESHEPEFTNSLKGFQATLDYIFKTSNLEVVRVLPGISPKDIEACGGIPSVEYPSDHISIAAELRICQ